MRDFYYRPLIIEIWEDIRKIEKQKELKGAKYLKKTRSDQETII